MFQTKLLVVSAGVFFAAGMALGPNGHANEHAVDSAGNNKVVHETLDHAKGNAGKNGGSLAIRYWGGPVMTGMNNKIYYIWYGNWSGNSAPTILDNLAKSIGGSPYFNINTTYYNGSGTHVSNSVTFAGEAYDNNSQGASLTDAGVANVVANALNTGALPVDTSGIYFVLTSKDVDESSGFCTQYCGWHTNGTYTVPGNPIIKYAFVGNPERCPSACQAQPGNSSPNGNLGADGMASIIAHELEEAITDPQLNAWFDTRGAENADKCAWTFGTTSTAQNGSLYNVTLGGKNYLIQRNWDASKQACAMSKP